MSGASASPKGDLQAEPPGGIAAELADHGLGRSRGPDWDQVGPGPIGPGAGREAYGSRANRGHLRRRGIACSILGKVDQVRDRKNEGRASGRPPSFSAKIYKQRHVVQVKVARLP